MIFNIQHYSLQDGPGIRTTVFFKKCPLRCLWCSNPESVNPFAEVAHNNSLCNGCGRCVLVCDTQAILLKDSRIGIDRDRCNNCGHCVEVCPVGALKVFGYKMTPEEIVTEIKKDSLFYLNSGGGMTASGGEPLAQPAFLVEILRHCQAAAIHTAIETTGYASPRVLDKVLDYTDLVLFDVKHLDSAAHQAVTGRSNELILRNAKRIAERRVPVIIRIPLIPGINSSKENLEATASFVRSLKHVEKVDILPYHRFGISKYQMLDRSYQLSSLVRPSPEEAEQARRIIESLGLACEVIE